MKFIHVSDIHIGITPDPTMSWASDRASDIKDSFANVIKKCKEEGIDLLLISGDFFNHQAVTVELNDVNELFKTIPNTKVMIVAGSSDCIKSNSPILNFKFADNVYYFLNEFPEEVEIKDLSVSVHGFSYYSQEEPSTMIDSIIVPNDGNMHILLAYGGDNRHCPIDYNLLAKKNFIYCALGSKKNKTIAIENKAVFPGTLEPLSLDEENDHGVFVGEIDERKKKLKKLDFVKMAKASYIKLNYNINGGTTQDDLIELVTKDVNEKGIDNIYNINVSGLRDPDIEFTKDIFNKRIKIANFNDQTEPKYDFVKLSKEHPQDMIGAFIRNFQEKELSDIEKKALYYGTNALIKTSDKMDN